MSFTPIVNRTREATTVHVIGKCPVKGCTKTRRHTLAGSIIRDRFGARTTFNIPSNDERFTNGINHIPMPDTRPGDKMYETDWLLRGLRDAMRELGWTCEEHNRFFKLTAVKGVVNMDKTCDGRCVSAKGANCECPCGGAMHGMAYA